MIKNQRITPCTSSHLEKIMVGRRKTDGRHSCKGATSTVTSGISEGLGVKRRPIVSGRAVCRD